LLVSQPALYLELAFIILSFCIVRWTSIALLYDLIRMGVYGSVLFIFNIRAHTLNKINKAKYVPHTRYQ
jgi:hypothetical protein